MSHLKKTKFVVAYICLLLFLAAFGFTNLSFAGVNSDEETIIKTFKDSGAQFQRLTVNGWVLVDYKDYGNDLRALLRQRAAELVPYGFTLSGPEGNEKSEPITIRGRSKEGITVSLTITRLHEGISENKEGYLILTLETRNLTSYKLMEQIYYKLLKDETNRSIVINGYIDKKLSLPETNRVVEEMIKSANIQDVEMMAEHALVSVSGYSPNVRSLLTLDGKSVNINMALRYNSLDDRTMVYVGSPIITIEY